MTRLYSRDLAFVHDTAFGEFSRRVAPEVLAILRARDIPTGRIVEIGCGSGVLAKRLVNAGYAVRGFDISPAMVQLARKRAPTATFRVADIGSLKVPDCDAVICVGEIVSYVRGGLPTLRKFFRRVYNALPPGGLFVFDFMHSARRRTYPTRTIGGNGWSMEVRADYDRHTRTLTRQMAIVRRFGPRVRHSRETHTVRIYRRGDILAALRGAGFRATPGAAIGRYRLLPGDTAVVAHRRGI